MLDSSIMSEYGVPIKRQRITPPLTERVMLYVRQDNEDVYTALHVVPPTTNGLISAVSEIAIKKNVMEFLLMNFMKLKFSLLNLTQTQENSQHKKPSFLPSQYLFGLG